LAGHCFKYAIEMRERLETDFVSDLAHATIAVKQERLGFLDSYPGEVIGEDEAGRAFEEFAFAIRCRKLTATQVLSSIAR
jgi:hypothetical protein